MIAVANTVIISLTEGRRLREQRQVAQGEVQLHGLLHVNHHGILILYDVVVVNMIAVVIIVILSYFINSGVLLQHDVTRAQVTGRGETNTFL